MAAFKVREHATQGTLSLVTDVASNVVAGVAGLAKSAVLGRDDGYRAGRSPSLPILPTYYCYLVSLPVFDYLLNVMAAQVMRSVRSWRNES